MEYCPSLRFPKSRVQPTLALPFFQYFKIFLVPKIAPDVLRISAKQFIGEDYNVKLQIMNLSAKMSLMENMSEQTKLAITYIFNLARYDQR